MNEDEKRLLFMSGTFDEMAGIDLHERASTYALGSGREEPNDDDYLNAVRDAIDAAREG